MPRLRQIADPVRAESARAIRELTDAGIETWLVTGDGRGAANAIGAQVGIPAHRVVAEVPPEGKAQIIVCANNFHGRTVTIVSFSSDEQYRDGFGPFTPGFKIIPFGAAEEAVKNCVQAAITEGPLLRVAPFRALSAGLMPPRDPAPGHICEAVG